MQAHDARKCRFYKHVHSGIGGTEVGFYRQLEDHGTGKSRVRHVDVSIGGTEMKAIQAWTCCFWRHGYQRRGCTIVLW